MPLTANAGRLVPMSTVASISRKRKDTATKQSPVYVIKRSPYESFGLGKMRRCAENGEEPFDRFLRILDPKGAKRLLDDTESENSEEDEYDDAGDSSTSSVEKPLYEPELARLVQGDANAEIVALAYHHIDRSGMCYSSQWIAPAETKDSMNPLTMDARSSARNTAASRNFLSHLQSLPKPILLLCLRPERFSKATCAVLREITIDLNCHGFVLRALVDLNLLDQYKNLRAAELPYFFSKSRVACYKCVVFVARTVAVMQFFEKWKERATVVEESLMTKLHACFRILDDSVRVDPIIAASLEEEYNDEEDVASSMAAKETTQAQPKKRKERRSDPGPGRKRPPRAVSTMEVSDTTETMSAASAEGSDGPSDKDSRVSSISHSASQPGATSSVPFTIGDNLREQHERIGSVVDILPHVELKEQHQRLGEMISKLQEQIQLDPATLRKQWKEEMRNELMKEMSDKKAANHSGKTKKRKRK
ncbi:hypothetical protein IV203_032449 [Nitzschia inconspicua]|uniref:Uncharacterized protein n=1 Tax=Nitzschia inconspicua TaxID=303405 RepID=A0A9K3KJN4_9STRA|nr:hypothetical protein IV203_032449 [Nitzschia inconspicua]